MSDHIAGSDKWDIKISAGRGYLDINFRELWHYRDLLMMFVKKDIITVYKQTILGPLWFLVQPVLTSLMFLFIFSGIAKIPTGKGIPLYRPFQLSKMLVAANRGVPHRLYMLIR